MRIILPALAMIFSLGACKEKEYCWKCTETSRLKLYSDVGVLLTERNASSVKDTCSMTETQAGAYEESRRLDIDSMTYPPGLVFVRVVDTVRAACEKTSG